MIDRTLPKSVRIGTQVYEFRKLALEQVESFGIARLTVARAYEKWRKGAPFAECQYGRKEQAIALECNCIGCTEARCFFYFDQVAKTFNLPG